MKLWDRRREFRRPMALLFACLFIAGSALPMGLSAQEDSEDSEVSQQDALPLIRAGNDAFDAADYETAYDAYQQAHEILPEPTIRYRMGQSAQELGLLREAIAHYEAYLEEGNDLERLAHLNEVLPRLRDQIPAVLVVESEPAGATIVVVSGEEEAVLGESPMEVEVAPGEVEVLLRLEGYDEAQWSQTVEPDSRQEWSVELAEASEGDEGIIQPFDDDLMAGDEGASLAIWGWSSAGLGVALLVTGGVFSFLQADATEQANSYDKRAPDASRLEWESLKSDATTYHRIALGSYIAGGILTAAGAGILTMEFLGSDRDQGMAMSFQGGVSSEGGFVGLQGRF